MKKIFIIGDSISIHYGPYLEQYVNGYFKYERKGRLITGCDINEGGLQNGGDSNLVWEYLCDNPELDYDVLVLNCGLHDIRIFDKDNQVDIKTYEKNLKKIIQLAKERNKKVVWLTSTPVDDEWHNTQTPDVKRYNKDIINYNETALNVMKQLEVPVIDLYGFTCNIDVPLYEDYVHYNIEVRRLQASFIAGSLMALDSLHEI